MKVIYYHGLESRGKSAKSEYLNRYFNAETPAMDYYDKNIFNRELKRIQSFKPELLIGSSMGGWLAYALSTHTGIPTLLFNPAVHGRTMDINFPLGNKKAKQTVVLGKNDDVVNPEISKQWFKKNSLGTVKFHDEDMGHRTSVKVLDRYIGNKKINEKMKYAKTFKSFSLNEKDYSHELEDIIGKAGENYAGVKGEIVDAAYVSDWKTLKKYDSSGWMSQDSIFKDYKMQRSDILVAFKPKSGKVDVYTLGDGGIEVDTQ